MGGDGIKHDAGKDRWDLLPWEEVRDVVKVLTKGAEKYGEENWQAVPEAEDRYFAAAHRHLVEWRTGDCLDPDDGLPHLAHAVCCLLFLMWGDKRP